MHQGLNLDVKRGEVLGVVGGSGTGKSVLLRSIVGLRRPTDGKIHVFGKDLMALSGQSRAMVERRFGVLFQRGALFSSLTVTENVALPLIENAGLPRSEAERLAQVKLALAGLPPGTGSKYPASLSGGMVKRVALARALALDPDILFLDEPTAGLDPIGIMKSYPFELSGGMRRCIHCVIVWRCFRRKKCWWLILWIKLQRLMMAGFRRIFMAHVAGLLIRQRQLTVERGCNMETRAHHVVIGLFTLIVVSAALLFCLWLTNSGSDRQFRLYDIVFNEPVSGLSQGSTVQYSGIRVGEVTQLRLDRDNPNKVWARIRVSASTPIREDTQARLTVAGITGTSNIQFSSGSQTSPLLEGKDDEVPIIIATPSPMSQLLANGENFMTNANEVLVRLNQLLAPDNQQRLVTTLDNLALVTQTVADQRGDLRTLLQQLAQASKQANETLTQTNRLLRNANGLMDGQGKQLVSDAAKTMASLQNTSTILNKLVSENKTSLNNGMQGMNELGPAVDELRRTLATLRAAVSRLEENPAALLRGRERTQEFTP